MSAYKLSSAITTFRPLPNIDVVDEGIPLPPLQRGCRLLISPVGAYNVTQWMQFIEYRPNVVLIREDGTVAIIRHAEDLATLEQQECCSVFQAKVLQ